MRCIFVDKEVEKLARKTKHGNANAYGELIELYKETLYRTAWLYVKDQQSALDIVGDCILNGFRAIHTLKEPAYFKTWITRILINAAKDYCRKHPAMDSIDNVPVKDCESSVSTEERIDLYRAMGMLSEKYQTVLILKYFDDLKIREIAEIMEIPKGSVKAYLNRAKTELRTLLKEDELYEERFSGYSNSQRIRPCCGGEYGASIQRT